MNGMRLRSCSSQMCSGSSDDRRNCLGGEWKGGRRISELQSEVIDVLCVLICF